MANRYYTLMVVPERSSRVKKWIVSRNVIRWVLATVSFVILLGLVTGVLSLRYIAKKGEFEEALLKNQYLEGELRRLQAKLGTADATIVRIQNFEQKMRVIAHLDQQPMVEGGIGPISSEDQRIMDQARLGEEVAKVTSAGNLPKESIFKVKSLELGIDGLHHRATLQEQSLQEVYELLKDQEALISSRPSIWPTKGWMTSTFGYRISPFTGLRQLHEGIDIAAPLGERVIAPADGIVTDITTDPGYGKVVVLNHGYGIVTRYGHNSEILVKIGQRVQRGTPISLVGTTGRSTAPHVHYEVRLNGLPVNPTRYILN